MEVEDPERSSNPLDSAEVVDELDGIATAVTVLTAVVGDSTAEPPKSVPLV